MRDEILSEVTKLIEVGELELARQKALLLNEFIPDTAELWLHLNAALERLQLSAQSEIMTVRFLSANPNCPEVELEFAARLVKRGRTIEAAEQIRNAIRHKVETIEFWLRATQLLMSLGDWTEAAAAAERGVSIDSSNFWLAQMFAESLFRLGRRRQGRMEATRLLGLIAGSASKGVELIRFAKTRGMDSLANSAFIETINTVVAQADPNGLGALCDVLNEHPDPAMIERVCTVLSTFRTSDPAVLRKGFQCAWSAGEYAVAEKLGQALLQVDAESNEIRNAMRQLEGLFRSTVARRE